LSSPFGRIGTAVVGAGLAASAARMWAPAAAAEPATTVTYPTASTTTRFAGKAFVACSAPSIATMRAWLASPYRGVGIYFGGASRTCTQPNLTASWVSQVSRMGWRLIPIYKGLQPPCGARTIDPKINPSTAFAQGSASADDAAAKATALGLRVGSAFYLDIEYYARTNTTCRTAVLSFISGWTKRLHGRGYLAGVYMNLNLGAADLAGVYNSTAYARPDALWVARYDGVGSTTGWSGISSKYWAFNQRGKQYRGGHDETYAGVRINIDTDQWDAPVASVSSAWTVTSSVPLNARSGPSTAYPVVRSHQPRSTLQVLCQVSGQLVNTTRIWDRLTDGTYVSDYWVSTPSRTTWSGAPRCAHSYQVAVPDTLNMRTGPSSAYPVAGVIANGGLARVWCQRSGQTVGTTKIWDQLDNGRWVSDYYVVNRSNTGYSAPVPLC
jgi:uncharacterized protein YraI